MTDAHNAESINELFKGITMQIPDEDKHIETECDCRVWLLKAVRVLVQTHIIKCNDVRALEKEILSLAEANDDNTITGREFRYHVARCSS